MGKRLRRVELLDEIQRERAALDESLAGLTPRAMTRAMPAPGYTLRALPRLNAMIYRKHHRRALDAVLRDFQSHHDRIVALITRLADADLVTLGRFTWTGPSWTLSDYLRASPAAHYLWARTRIRRWRRALSNGRAATTKGIDTAPGDVTPTRRRP